MSAHRPPRRRVPAPSPPIALLALARVLVALGLVGLGLPATAASAHAPAVVRTGTAPASAVPSPTPTGDDDDGSGSGDPTGEGEDEPPVTVLVTSVRPQVVRPEDELVVTARIRNDTDEPLRSARATLRVNRFLLSTRSTLQQWVDESLDGTAGTPIATVELPGPLASGDSADVVLRVPAAALGLSSADTAWGPRGLSVEAVDDGRRQGILRTFVLWQPTEQAVTPTRVSVLVPLTGGPVDPTVATTEPLLSPEDGQEGAAGGQDGGDGRGAEEDGSTPGSDDPDDPDATASPRAGEEGADGTDRTEPTDDATVDPGGTGADTASGPVLVAPTDADLDRLEDVLAATADLTGTAWAVDPALLAGARSTTASPRAERWVDGLTDAAAGREVVTLPLLDPDLAALAHGGGDALAAESYARARTAADPVLGATPRADLAWPADEVPDAVTVGLASRAGATAVVVGADALATERLAYTPTGRATVATPDGDVTALVPDAVLTDELTSPSDATAAAAAQRMLAESAVVTRERPNEQRHVLVTAPRTWDPEPGLARAQLAALSRAPWVEMSDVSDLVGASDPGLVRTPLPDREVGGDEIPPGDLTELGTARAQLAAFARIVPEPSRLLAGVDDAVLAPASVAWRVDPVQRAIVVDGVVADLVARRSGVSVVPGSSLNLISETGRFPLGLRNDLDQDVTVQVAVDPASPVLVIDGPQTVTIGARSEAQVRVPFHAVGSGDVQVAVTLLAPDGAPLAAAQELTVRVRADWENVGTAVVAGLLALALVVGIVRTIRRGQTRTRGAGSTPVSEIARLPEEPS